MQETPQSHMNLTGFSEASAGTLKNGLDARLLMVNSGVKH